MATPIGGQDTRISFGSSPFNMGVEEWKLELANAADIDYTNSESTQDSIGIAFTNRMAACKDATLTITAFYDLDNPPGDSGGDPPNLMPGATVSTVKVYTSKNGNLYYSFPSMIVQNSTISMRIKDKVTVNATLKPNGTWSVPT